MTLLIPSRSVFSVDQPILIEADQPGDLVITHLGERVRDIRVESPGLIDIGTLPEGGYGIRQPDTGASTAVQVLDDPRSRLRYGFVASFHPDKNIGEAVRFARRLHLNAIQFYDWAYRHADLMGGGSVYDDALRQPIALDVVRELIRGYSRAGIDSVGYAAVYAVGVDEWGEWEDGALLRSNGEPYSLADFLKIVDPAFPRWTGHFSRDVKRAADELGFTGFHLDQYGYPKTAVRADGAVIDVEESFMTMIRAIRAAIPDSRLVFNNVNDFPTWATGSAPQDAVYIEPWEPTTTLGDLARVVLRARSVAGGKPVVLAAYQSVYASASREQADAATRLTMAALYSHGATQLLVGEGGNVLVDPYYVDNRCAEDATIDMLAKWYDFAVENDELLLAPNIVDVTASYAGDHNGDMDVDFGSTPVTSVPEPHSVWRRITKTPDGLVVHLINLNGQDDTSWDGPHTPPTPIEGAVLRFTYLWGRTPIVTVADPDVSTTLTALPVTIDDSRATVQLPALNTWQVIHVRL